MKSDYYLTQGLPTSYSGTNKLALKGLLLPRHYKMARLTRCFCLSARHAPTSNTKIEALRAYAKHCSQPQCTQTSSALCLESYLGEYCINFDTRKTHREQGRRCWSSWNGRRASPTCWRKKTNKTSNMDGHIHERLILFRNKYKRMLICETVNLSLQMIIINRFC